MEAVALSAESQRGGAVNRRSWKTNRAHLIKLMHSGNYLMETLVLLPSDLRQSGNLAEEKLRAQQMPGAEQNESCTRTKCQYGRIIHLLPLATVELRLVEVGGV